MRGVMFLAGGLLLAEAATGYAQRCEGRLEGVVVDPAQAALVGATVRLSASGGAAPQAVTDRSGRFLFACPPAGPYTLHVEANGFAPADVPAAGGAPLTVELQIAAVEQEVEVGPNDGASLDEDHGPGTHTLTTSDVAQLADDPDDFQRQLQVLAATSGGAPGQATITVDGFQNASALPPKSSIASIRINPDMFSAEYETPPYRGGRIEIFTKPGLDSVHGALFLTDSDASFNANDPFSTAGTPAGKRRYGFELSGPIERRKSDYSVAFEKRDIDEFAVVNAVALDADAVPVNVSESVPAPQRLWIASARADFSLRGGDIATVSYSANVSELANQGVGGLLLQQAGYGVTQSEHVLRLTNMQTLSANLLHSTHASYAWKDTANQPNATAPALEVAGAFTGGGATSQQLRDRERNLEIDDDLSVTRGAHTLKLGAEALGIFVHATDPDTFNGAYVFGGNVSAPNLDGAGSTVISGLEQYRRAVLGLPGGTPTTYEYSTGSTLVPFTQWRLALYAQDTWKLRPRLSVSAGLRYALETSPDSYANFAPRAGVAWSPDRKSKWVLRARAGLFSSPVAQATTLSALRLNGTRQTETLIYNPSYAAPLSPQPGSLAVTTLRSFAAHAGQSPSFQAQLGVEHDLPRHWHAQANVFLAQGWDLLRTRNINAPLVTASTTDPLLAPRPGAPNLNQLQYQQSGNLHGQVWFLGLDQHSYKHFGFFLGYLHYNLKTDADGPDTTPQNAFSDRGEMARPVWQNDHRVFLIGQASLPWKISVAPQFDAASGAPYNVVTGSDTNGDGVFNDRPGYAASQAGTGVYQTPFGLLTSAVNGNLARNVGTMPATVHLDLNMSRAFALGGRRGDHPQTVTLNARSANLLNHTNVTAVGTVLGSPTFGASLAAETARRVELGARYTF